MTGGFLHVSFLGVVSYRIRILAKELAHEYGWAEDSKDYKDMLNSIRKKHKGLMKMSNALLSMMASIHSPKPPRYVSRM